MFHSGIDEDSYEACYEEVSDGCGYTELREYMTERRRDG